MNLQANVAKIALGTVQFGTSYGVANRGGQVQQSEIARILNLARKSDITTLDTAVAYGESERVLGQQNLNGLTLITKLPSVPEGCSSVMVWVRNQVQDSLERLNVPSLDGLLLHRPNQLLQPFGHELFQEMLALKQRGIIRRLGISVYSPAELETLCGLYHFDLVQAPFNILDNRLVQSGWLERLNSMGTAMHVRSVFMQGLLLMPKDDRPAKFSRWEELWNQWERWLQVTEQTAVEACLQHALAIPQIEKVVVGVDSYRQLQQIIQAADGPRLAAPEGLECFDAELLTPSNWNDL